MKSEDLRKKLMAAGLSIILAFGLAACGGSGSSAQKETKEEVQETADSAAETQEASTEEAAEEPAEEIAVAEEIAGEIASQKAVDIAEAEEPAAEAKETAGLGDYLVFSGEKMGFSFLYESKHTARVTESGAAILAINGDTRYTGLFVSVVDAENMPEVSQILEEDTFNAQQKYGSKLLLDPERDSVDASGHKVEGIYYAYLDGSDIILCSSYVEVRDGKYIFYQTEGVYTGENAELYAMGIAIGSLQFDPLYYGEGDASAQSLGDQVSGKQQASGQAGTQTGSQGKGDASPSWVGNPEMESGFYFDTDSGFLIISDESTTMVYTTGTMKGASFTVERTDIDPGHIGEYVVERKNYVTDFLGVRRVTAPEVKTIDLGSRRLAGLEYAYSSVDGTRTIESAEYYEEIDGTVYSWYALWDRGDKVTRDAMMHAIETFIIP